MNINHNFLNGVIVLGIMFGTVECFFGYRLFKIILGVLGFILGGALVAEIGNLMVHNEIFSMFLFLVGGLIGAVLMVWLYFFGVFIIGGILGGVCGSALLSAFQINPNPMVVFIIALICGGLALIFQKLMIIVATSFAGAWHVVFGIASLIYGANNLLHWGGVFRTGGSYRYIFIIGWIVLGALGCFVQYQSVPAGDTEKD